MNYLFHLDPQALRAIDRTIVLLGYDPALVSRRGCLVTAERDEFLAQLGFPELAAQRALDAQPQNLLQANPTSRRDV